MVENGAANGKGIFYNINGNVQIGEWYNNELMSGKDYSNEKFNSLSRPGEKEILKPLTVINHQSNYLKMKKKENQLKEN